MNMVCHQMYIKNIIDDTSKILLITRPRRFGKTLNMSMLRYYFDCTKKDSAELFEGLKIYTKNKKKKIQEEIDQFGSKNPSNLEEQAISLVGKTIYTKLVKEYTEKQWNKDCKDLPSFIIKRLPVRFEFNNNYFNDKYQGIPVKGYTHLIEKLLDGVEVRLNENYLANKEKWSSIADKVIYTGPVDELFDYQLGELEYRSLKFVEKRIEKEDYQGNAVVNYTSHDVPFTRVIEHKHFNNDKSPVTIIFEEYPQDFKRGMERYYTVNDEKNNALYEKYVELAKQNKNLILGGRLGHYKYYDMDDAIEAALNLVKSL